MAYRAPVSGNPKVVSAGKLSLAVSGPRDTCTLILERARRSGITLAAENVKVDDGLEAL